MKRLPTIIFLLLCFGVGIVLAMAYQHSQGAGKNATAGIGIGNAPPLRGFSLPASADKSLVDAFPPMHATAVAIDYPDDPAVLAAFAYHAHKLGLKVLLLPNPHSGTAAEVDGGANPFPHSLAAIAAEAQAAEVDVLCIAWLNTDPDANVWLPQIAQVRKNFAGRLILAATPEILPGIEFLDQVDLIGAIGPFDLPIRNAARIAQFGVARRTHRMGMLPRFPRIAFVPLWQATGSAEHHGTACRPDRRQRPRPKARLRPTGL